MAETYAQAAPGIIGGFSFIVFLVNRKDYEHFLVESILSLKS